MIRPRTRFFVAAVAWLAGGAQIGTARADDVQVNTYTTSGQRSPSVTLDPDGDFVVVWHSEGSEETDSSGLSIQGQRYAADGSTLGGEFQVNTYTLDLQYGASVAVAADGDFVVVWTSLGSDGTDTDDRSIQGQRYAANGSAVGSEFQINTFTTSFQSVSSVAVAADGDFVVVWQSLGSGGTDLSSHSIQGQRYAANGSTAGSEFQINTFTTSFQSVPSVAAAMDGDFVVVWQSFGSGGTDISAHSIQGQRYAADGSTLGGEFQVNTYSTGSQSSASVAVDTDGDFVVVWHSEGSGGTDSSSTSIQGQRYAADGSTLGGEFQVNTYTTYPQYSPSVALSADGDFVIMWTSLGSGGTDSSACSIQGQRYAVDGSTVGGEFQVNTYTTSLQISPSVALDDAGFFVVVWESSGSDGTDTDSGSIQKSDVLCLNDAVCDDGVSCTLDECAGAPLSCDNVADDGRCDNGTFCDGMETCDPVLDCLAAASDPCDDGVGCTLDDCNETTDSCVNLPADGLCDDGLFCDGTETCDPLLDCLAGSDPCPFEACDEIGEVCLPVIFADGFESGDTSRW